MDAPKFAEAILKLLNDFITINDESLSLLRAKDEDPVFLDTESCPTGLIPCNPATEVCPDAKYAPHPPMFNSRGEQCFDRRTVQHERKFGNRRDALRVNVRDFVEYAAKLLATLQEKVETLSCDSFNTVPELCGTKLQCKYDESTQQCLNNVAPAPAVVPNS